MVHGASALQRRRMTRGHIVFISRVSLSLLLSLLWIRPSLRGPRRARIYVGYDLVCIRWGRTVLHSISIRQRVIDCASYKHCAGPLTRLGVGSARQHAFRSSLFAFRSSHCACSYACSCSPVSLLLPTFHTLPRTTVTCHLLEPYADSYLLPSSAHPQSHPHPHCNRAC